MKGDLLKEAGKRGKLLREKETRHIAAFWKALNWLDCSRHPHMSEVPTHHILWSYDMAVLDLAKGMMIPKSKAYIIADSFFLRSGTST